MKIYAYRCRTCGAQRDSTLNDDIRPCSCGGISKRDWSGVQFGPTGLKPHFNHAVGQYVRSNREFNDALKRKAEENSIATGLTHTYSRLDPGDAPEPPNAAEAIEARAKTLRDKGLTNAR